MKYLGKILLFNVYLFQSMSFFPCERHFSSLLGSKGGQKRGSKFAISNKIIPKSWILHRDIIFDHRFYTVTHLVEIIGSDPFWSTLGIKKGRKLSISLKVTPQKLQICTGK